MSKSNYGEIVGLLQYIDSVRNQKTKGLFKRKDKPKNPLEYLQEMKAAAKAYDDFIKEQEKLNKKEDKGDKRGWDALSPIQQAAYLTFAIQAMSLLWLSFFIKLVR